MPSTLSRRPRRAPPPPASPRSGPLRKENHAGLAGRIGLLTSVLIGGVATMLCSANLVRGEYRTVEHPLRLSAGTVAGPWEGPPWVTFFDAVRVPGEQVRAYFETEAGGEYDAEYYAPVVARETPGLAELLAFDELEDPSDEQKRAGAEARAAVMSACRVVARVDIRALEQGRVPWYGDNQHELSGMVMASRMDHGKAMGFLRRDNPTMPPDDTILFLWAGRRPDTLAGLLVGGLIGLGMLIGGVWWWRRVGYLPPVLPESEESYRSGINLIVGVFAFGFLTAAVLFGIGVLE